MEIRINVPLTVRHTVFTPLGPDTRSRIEASFHGATVLIEGPRETVDAMTAGTPADPQSLIQRALSALGYVVGEHQKDVAQFSRWVDSFSKFPQTIDAEKLWTDAMLARLNSPEPPMTEATIDEASSAAARVVIQRMRLFPATVAAIDGAMMIGIDPGTEELAELQEWREAAKANGIKSAEELAESGKINFGQFVDRKVSRDWQLATQCDTATGADELIKSFRAANVDLQSKLDDLSAKLHKRDQDLLAANTEIDRVKAAARTLGLVSDDAKELAKIRAELQSKCREAQTEKERADAEFRRRVDAETHLHNIEEMQHEFTGLRPGYSGLASEIKKSWDQVKDSNANLRTELKAQSDRASTAESMFYVEQQKHDDTKKELLVANQKLANAIILLPKPEKVEADQRWAYTSKIRYVYGAVDGDFRADIGDWNPIKASYLLSSDTWVFVGS